MLNEIEDSNTILSYVGPFYIDILCVLSKNLRAVVKYDNCISLKLYRIFIELYQNVAKYAAFTDNTNGIKTGMGSISVVKEPEFFRLTTRNEVPSDSGKAICRYCEELNALSNADLRAFKAKKREQLILNDTGGHIGMIQMRVLSAHRIDCTIRPKSDGFVQLTISTLVLIK